MQLGKPNNNSLLSRLTEKYIRDLFDEHDINETLRIELIEYYYNHLSKAIDNNFGEKLDYKDEELVKSLKKNIADFSAFKEADFKNALYEILAENNTLPTWSEFKKAAKAKDIEYNERHLKTEYDHTVSSANIAKKWREFEEDKDIYPNLEFHTIGDRRVRDAHKKYNGLIAAVDDPVWLKLTIPLDWGCRCYITQTTGTVNKTKYDTSGDDIKEVFKNNPAKSGEIFKNKEPYSQRLSEENKETATQLANKVIDKKEKENS